MYQQQKWYKKFSKVNWFQSTRTIISFVEGILGNGLGNDQRDTILLVQMSNAVYYQVVHHQIKYVLRNFLDTRFLL
jgi:hypothetical protein